MLGEADGESSSPIRRDLSVVCIARTLRTVTGPDGGRGAADDDRTATNLIRFYELVVRPTPPLFHDYGEMESSLDIEDATPFLRNKK